MTTPLPTTGTTAAPAAPPAQPRPRLLFLHGPASCGKLTVARELVALRPEFALFHNHLTVDLLLALFPFGSPAFVRHRERLWLELIPEAIAAGTSLVFTFHPEATVAPEFPSRLTTAVAAAGGETVCIALTCPEPEIERRLASDTRRAFKKLADLALYRRLRVAGAFTYPPIPSTLTFDTSQLAPAETAAAIARHLT